MRRKNIHGNADTSSELVCVSHDLDSGCGVSRGGAVSLETCFVADNEVSWR